MKHESCYFVCFTSANKESRRVRGGDSVQGCLQTVQPAQQDGAAWEQEEEAEATAASLLPCTTDDHDNHNDKEANYQSDEEEAAPYTKAKEDDKGSYHDDAQAKENCQGPE